MHKEEFYSTLLEDEFISYLIREIKILAKEKKLNELINLIDHLEYDGFLNYNNLYSNNNGNNNSRQNTAKEMTRFSLFLDNQLKEIIERQNTLELQIQSLKASNNINDLNNLSNLLNLKNNGSDFFCPNFQKTGNTSNENSVQESSCNNKNFNKVINRNTQNNSKENKLNTIESTNNQNLHYRLQHSHSHSSGDKYINNSKNKTVISCINCSSKCCMNITNGINTNQNISTTNTNFNIINTSSGHTSNKKNNIGGSNIKANLGQNSQNGIYENIMNNPTCPKKTSVVNGINSSTSQTINNSSGNKNRNGSINHIEKINDIDELVAYINTNTDSKQTKKNKKKLKNPKKKNQQQNKNLQPQNNTGINDEFVVENFRKNIYKDSCYAENIRKIKPVFSMEWLKTINNIVK